MKWLFSQRRSLKQWRKQWRIQAHQAVFDALYHDINGFTLSKAARKNKDSIEYVYGEILFEPFIALLNMTNPEPETCFYDLGSGSGKAVIAAAMVFDLKKSHGIELFQSLSDTATQQIKKLKDNLLYQKKSVQIDCEQGDIKRAQFRDATVIFINATAFFGESWREISEHIAQQVAPGTQVISTSKPLKSTQFIIKKTCFVEMSFGVVKAYISIKQEGSDISPTAQSSLIH